jgi:hypothetical protein
MRKFHFLRNGKKSPGRKNMELTDIFVTPPGFMGFWNTIPGELHPGLWTASSLRDFGSPQSTPPVLGKRSNSIRVGEL